MPLKCQSGEVSLFYWPPVWLDSTEQVLLIQHKGSFRRAVFDACGCGRSVRCRKIENFLSLRKRNCLSQPHASNAVHLNEPLGTQTILFVGRRSVVDVIKLFWRKSFSKIKKLNKVSFCACICTKCENSAFSMQNSKLFFAFKMAYVLF